MPLRKAGTCRAVLTMGGAWSSSCGRPFRPTSGGWAGRRALICGSARSGAGARGGGGGRPRRTRWPDARGSSCPFIAFCGGGVCTRCPHSRGSTRAARVFRPVSCLTDICAGAGGSTCATCTSGRGGASARATPPSPSRASPGWGSSSRWCFPWASRASCAAVSLASQGGGRAVRG